MVKLHGSNTGHRFAAIVISSEGCLTETDTVDVLFIGVGDFASSRVKIYPNPVSDLITIEGLMGRELTLELLNIQGQILRSRHSIHKDLITLPVADLSAGEYLIRIRSEHIDVDFRILKLP